METADPAVFRRASLALTQFWCTSRRDLSFRSNQSGLQEIEMASAVHLTLHELEFRDLAFGLTV